jgi:hypothetical protein
MNEECGSSIQANNKNQESDQRQKERQTSDRQHNIENPLELFAIYATMKESIRRKCRLLFIY